MTRHPWRAWANALKRNVHALYLAGRHPRVPLLSKVVIGLVVAYALSPIDLIPDFIPVLGYLDDLLLLPLGIWLAVRLIPGDVWRECQLQATAQQANLPHSRGTAVVIAAIWLLAAGWLLLWVLRQAGAGIGR